MSTESNRGISRHAVERCRRSRRRGKDKEEVASIGRWLSIHSAEIGSRIVTSLILALCILCIRSIVAAADPPRSKHHESATRVLLRRDLCCVGLDTGALASRMRRTSQVGEARVACREIDVFQAPNWSGRRLCSYGRHRQKRSRREPAEGSGGS
jgi:hypothetical protein